MGGDERKGGGLCVKKKKKTLSTSSVITFQGCYLTTQMLSLNVIITVLHFVKRERKLAKAKINVSLF